MCKILFFRNIQSQIKDDIISFIIDATPLNENYRMWTAKIDVYHSFESLSPMRRYSVVLEKKISKKLISVEVFFC